ncbi:branched-chain amino acid ABC transporter permease [Streptomyces sp. NPDC055815]
MLYPSSRGIAAATGGLVLLALPLYVDGFWLQAGLFAMAAVVGALGINLLTGVAGQLSMGHAFFLSVGAYGYTWAAGDSGRSGAVEVSGLGLPPLAAFVLAVLLAGLAGGILSPVSGRVRGIYLGVATLALVFLGQHLLQNATSVTGGFNGRSVEPMSILGFAFTDGAADGLTVLGVPFGALERLWYFGLVLVAVAWLTARNLLRSRPGRALGALRDSPTAAAVMGVAGSRYRAAAFAVSSMYAGAAGALVALVVSRVVPDYFSLMLSIDYLAMIVIGGLGSVGGAVVGAVFVTLLPQLLTRYADTLPLVVGPGSVEPGLAPSDAARYLYGTAIVFVLIFAPGGLAALAGSRGGRRWRNLVRRRSTVADHDKEQTP